LLVANYEFLRGENMKKVVLILIILGLALMSCMPSNLPNDSTTNNPPTQPTNPTPNDGATDVSITPTLSWEASDPDGDTLTFDIYFGTDSSPTLAKSNLTTKTYSPGTLEPNTTYYWKVVAKDDKGGVTEGPVWSFKTIIGKSLSLESRTIKTGRVYYLNQFTVQW
jgi:hypothetical protein